MFHLPSPSGEKTALRISPDGRHVVVDGHRVELSDAEASMLSCLVAHAGEPVSRSRLQDALKTANIGRDIPERAVDFAMRRLRIKLEANAGAPQLLQTVRGQGYRFVPPRRSDARAATEDAGIGVSRHLARMMQKPGGLLQIIGGLSPRRSGLVRELVDDLGGAPPGGVVWIPGSFSGTDQLQLAVAACFGPGLPSGLRVVDVLLSRAPTVVVVDSVVSQAAGLGEMLREWRTVASQHRWVVFTSATVSLDADERHDLGPASNPAETAEFVAHASRAARRVLAHLLAHAGSVDINLLVAPEEETAIDELAHCGLVRVSGRGVGRRATLVAGSAASVAASLPVSEQIHGRQLARQIASSLVPRIQPNALWDLFLPERSVRARAVRHHALLMAAVDGLSSPPRIAEIELAVSAFSMLCVGMPRRILGEWLWERGEALFAATAGIPRLGALVRLALAWLELPFAEPVLLGTTAALGGAGTRAEVEGALLRAEWMVGEAQRVADEHNVFEVEPMVATLRARIAAHRGDEETAERWVRVAMLHHQAEGNVLGVAATSLVRAENASILGATERCATFLADAVARLHSAGRPQVASQAQAAYGRLLVQQNVEYAARLHLDTALTQARSEDALCVVAIAAAAMSVLEEQTDQTEEARLRASEARRAAARLGDPRVSFEVARTLDRDAMAAR